MDGGDAFLAVFIAGVVGVTVFAAAFDYVDYEADEGVESVAGDGIHFSWDTVTLVATVREGYVFEGWYGEDGELLTESAAVTLEADDVTLRAKTRPAAEADVIVIK